MITIVAVVLTFILAIFMFISFKEGFYLIFFLRPIIELTRSENILIFGLSIQDIIGVLFPVLLLIIIIIKKNKPIKIDLFLGLFIILVIATQLIHGSNNIIQLIRVISPLPFLIFPQMITWDEKELRKFIRAICYSIPFVIIAVIISYNYVNLVYTQVIVDYLSIGRWGGIFFVPTRMAYWLTIFILSGIFLFIYDKDSKLRYPILILSILLLFPLYRTFSRTAWAALFISLLILFHYNNKKFLTRTAIAVMLIMILFISSIGERLLADVGGAERLVLWIPLIVMFYNLNIVNMLFGLGWGGIEKQLVKYYAFPVAGSGITENAYLYIMIGTGIIALIFYILFWVKYYRINLRIIKNISDTKIKGFSIFGLSIFIMMAIQGLTDDLIVSPVMTWYYYAIAGVIISIYLQNFNEFLKLK